ncbi:MAG TPA: hypothetical protein VGO62_04310 [Myxococcota bacterium]|jgi:hypothetical protein
MSGDVDVKTLQRSRVPESLAVTLLVVTLAVWLGALVTARPPPTPSIAIAGEPLLPAGMPRAFRVLAAVPNAEKRSTVAGTVSAGGVSAPIDNGTARLPASATGPLTFNLVVDGVTHVLGSARQDISRHTLGPPLLHYESWSQEVQMVGDHASHQPIYVVDGVASGRLPSHALVLDEHLDARALDLAPDITGVNSGDGRVLRADRTGLQIEAPLEADAGQALDVVITSAEPRTVGVDLIVDGAVVDAKNIAVDKSGSAHVTLSLEGARPGDVAVVHAGGVWLDDLGRFAIVRVREPARSMQAWIDEVGRRAGVPPDEPMLAHLHAHPDDAVAARALLQRLVPAKLRAPRLAVTLASETGALGRMWRQAFSALALACVLAVLLLGVVRMRGRRALALVGVIAMAGLLAGLYLVVMVLAGPT